jgi:hypothetical protein
MLNLRNRSSGIIEALVSSSNDRRRGQRIKTVYKLVKVAHDQDEGLARCRNLSDGGAKLDLSMPLNLNDRITIGFTPDVLIEGQVIWLSGASCGIAFDQPIDSGLLLRSEMIANSHTVAGEQPRTRSPRLNTNLPAMVTHHGATHEALITDVSTRGVKIVNDGAFLPGLNVRVLLADGREKEGVVRWSRDNVAGVMLIEPFSVEELGSVHHLSEPGSKGGLGSEDRRRHG